MRDEFIYRSNSRGELLSGALGSALIGAVATVCGLWLLDGLAASKASARYSDQEQFLLSAGPDQYLWYGALLAFGIAAACAVVAIWCAWLAAFGKVKVSSDSQPTGRNEF